MSVNQARAKVAGLSRVRQPDDPELTTARRSLDVAKLEAHIARVVAEAPPLSRSQRSRLGALLRGGDAS